MEKRNKKEKKTFSYPFSILAEIFFRITADATKQNS